MDDEIICNIVNTAIEGLAAIWKRNPYLWLYEIDIQRDLAQRITVLLPENQHRIIARHSHDKQSDMQFSGVTCHPYVKIDKSRRAIHPNVVIWDDYQGDWGKGRYLNDGFFPIMWVCEIKYSFKNEEFGEDTDRMQALLATKRAQLTSQLILLQDKSGVSDRDERISQGKFTKWKIRSER